MIKSSNQIMDIYIMIVGRPLVCKHKHQINLVHELSLWFSFLLHYESAKSQAYEGQMEQWRQWWWMHAWRWEPNNETDEAYTYIVG